MAAFVLGPVTVDRSVSRLHAVALSAADHHADQRKKRAPLVNTCGGGTRSADGSRAGLSKQSRRETPQDSPHPQNRQFMEVARFMSALFDSDPRFVSRAHDSGLQNKTQT